MHMLRSDGVPASSRNSLRSSAELPVPTPPEGGWSAWFLTDEDDMGESYEHHSIIQLFLAALTALSRERGWTRSIVASDQFFAWVEAEPRVRVSPDVYVLDDPPVPAPDSWQTWRPGHLPPRFALEVVSHKWTKDYDDNPPKYAQLGARELVIFDPEARAHRLPLQIFRRDDANRWTRVAAGPGPLHSAELDAWLVVVSGTRLRIARDPAGADLVETPDEQVLVLRRENAELRRENAELRGRLAVADEQIQALRRENTELRARIDTLESTLARVLARLA